MEVKLISKSPDYLKILWVAARTCYSGESPIELLDKSPEQNDMLRLVTHIISSKHLSVLEHCSMTFAVKNVSRTLLAQYSRHRIGVSLSVQSQRYVSEQSAKSPQGIFDFIVPDLIRETSGAEELYLSAMRDAQDAYDKLVSLGIKKEDARFVLPGGAGTNFVTTLNLRSFFDVYEKRVLVPGAQWEIRSMLMKMAAAIQEEEPWLESFLKKIA